MKKITALILSILIFASFLAIPSFSEAPAGPTNYLTHKWTDDFFKGTITEEEVDGTTVTTYIPDNAYSWWSPNLRVFEDIKTLIGDKRGATVVITFEIKGVFANAGSSSNVHLVFRAVNPKSGGLPFPNSETGNWDGNGSSWAELYGDVAEGDMLFSIPDGNNNMFRPAPEYVDVLDDEWTLYETEPIYIGAADLDPTLFGDWLLCLDDLTFSSDFKGLQFRNTAIYDYDETKPTKAPTAEPTEAPATEPATEAPAKTDAPATKAPDTDPAKTNTPDDKATQAPKDDTSGKVNPGLIIGIIAGVVVIAAVIAIIVVKSKKKNESK